MIEKKVYSQHGEDGIIEYLISHLKECNKTFLEIGYGNGTQNNSLNLSKNHNWSGVGVDLKEQAAKPPAQVKIIQKIITLDSVNELLAVSGKDIDFYSVDIDSIDYWLTIALLNAGLNPKIVCVETMNSAGPDLLVAPPKNTKVFNKHYICGASVAAWRAFWEHRGYKFLTVDASGINAFFYKPEYFNSEVDNYPKIEYARSKRWIPYDDWLKFFTEKINLKDAIVTGKEEV